MKLAEALSIRADLQKKVAQLKERIKESAKVQEGDEPCDNVEELYKELDDVLVQLEDLIYRINITNVQIVQDGDSLTRLIAKRRLVDACQGIERGGELRSSQRYSLWQKRTEIC